MNARPRGGGEIGSMSPQTHENLQNIPQKVMLETSYILCEESPLVFWISQLLALFDATLSLWGEKQQMYERYPFSLCNLQFYGVVAALWKMWHRMRAEISERKWWTQKLSRDGRVKNIQMKELFDSLGESMEKQE